MDGSLNNASENKYISFYLDGTLEYNTSMSFDYYDGNTGNTTTDYYDPPLEIDGIHFGEMLDFYGPGYDYRSACFHLDEFRLSTNTMYCSNFTPPSTTFDQIVGEEPC